MTDGLVHNPEETGLDPQNVFEKIMIANNNRSAVSKASIIAHSPGYRVGNPFVIYGGVGLGKDLLIQATGNLFLKTHPGKKARYITAAQFLDEWENALSNGKLSQFRDKFFNLDFLLFDEFQLLINNELAQKEILLIFDTFVKSHRQIIIGSDRPPRAFLTINPQLKAILENGVTDEIQLPDYDTRLSILKEYWENSTFNSNLTMPPEVLEFIAHKVVSNFRELEGALTRVINYGLENKVDINIAVATRVLDGLMIYSRRNPVTSAQIIKQVAEFFSVEQEDLRGKGRSLNVVLPRQVAMYIIREQTEACLKEIGLALGERSPATVSDAVAKIEREIELNYSLRQWINTIVQILYSKSE